MIVSISKADRIKNRVLTLGENLSVSMLAKVLGDMPALTANAFLVKPALSRASTTIAEILEVIVLLDMFLSSLATFLYKTHHALLK